jgi:hypothetical protein
LAGNGTAPNPTPSPNFVIVDVNASSTPISNPNTPGPYAAGQQLHVAVKDIATNVSPSSITWSFPEAAIGNYIYPSSGPTAGAQTLPTAIPPSPNATDLTFYWTAGGQQKLIVDVTANGNKMKATANYTVAAPTALSMAATTNIPWVGLINGSQYGMELGKTPTNSSSGFSGTLTLTAPSITGGYLQVTQLIDNCVSVDLAGTFHYYGTSGGYWLDNYAPQPGPPLHVNAGNTGGLNYPDSPSNILNPALGTGSVFHRHDQFKTFYQFKPDAANSIWTTLWVLTWSWAASTTELTPPAWASPTAVSVSPPPNQSPVSLGSASPALPLWQNTDVTSVVYPAPTCT